LVVCPVSVVLLGVEAATVRSCFSQKLIGSEELPDCTDGLPVRLPVEDVESDEQSGL
jgi:hypothetical protein